MPRPSPRQLCRPDAFAGDAADVLLVFTKTGDPKERSGLSAFLFERPPDSITAASFPLLAPRPEFELHFDGCWFF